jgi:hypothetical protein
MASISIAAISVDGRHISGLTYGKAEAELCWCLQQSGFAAKLYNGRPEGSISDLARQIARMRTETYLFSICAYSAPVARALSRHLKQLRPNAAIIFWATESSPTFQVLALEACARLIVAQSVREVAELVAGGPQPTGPEERRVSLYRSSILPAAELGRIGIRANDESADDDVAWLAGSRSPGQTVVLEASGAASDKVAGLLARLRDAGVGQELVLHLEDESAKERLALDLGVENLPRVVVARALAADDESQLPATLSRAMTYARNGIIASYTGLYGDANMAPAIYHLDVPMNLPEETRRSVYDWAGDDMAAKSAAMLCGDMEELAPQLDRFSADTYSETGGWPKHVYSIGKGAPGTAWLDGERQGKFPIRLTPFRQLAETDPDPATVTIVSISDPADVDELEARLATFHSTGEMEVVASDAQLYFENSCRWLGFGACKLSVMRRIQVDAQLEVTSCRDAGPLGRVGDSIEKMVIAGRQNQQMEDVRRDCASCPVRDACSRCSSLPQTWNGRYCEIRKSNPATSLYFELWLFLRVLKQFVPLASDMTRLAVSSAGLPLRHYRGAARTVDDSKRAPIVSVGGTHFVWIRGTTKVVKVSDPLAAMLEGASVGATAAEISADLSARFGVGAASADAAVATGMAKLKQGGLLDG